MVDQIMPFSDFPGNYFLISQEVPSPPPWFLDRRGGCARNLTLFVTLQKCHSARTELRYNKKRK